MLLSQRKSYDKPRQHIKRQRHYFANKVHIVKAMVFSVVMYERESWTIKKAENRRTDAFEWWGQRRLLRISWTARRSNPSILKEINPEYSLEGLMLIAEAPVFWPPYAKRLLLLSHFSCVRLSGHESEQIQRNSEGQRSLVCCSPWGR